MSGGMHPSDWMARRWLKGRGYSVFQADWIASRDDDDFIVEAKWQERFEAPPFDGHGLPPRQVVARLNFMRRRGIRTLFLVFDKATYEVFYEWLDVLDSGAQFETAGRNRRRIYPLTHFQYGAPFNPFKEGLEQSVSSTIT
jgi:hypothetical protein